MAVRLVSCAVVGLDGILIEVTVEVEPGPPGIALIGLPDATGQGSQERVRAAIHAVVGRFPDRSVTVRLNPLDLLKAGPTFDLPIALGILLASGQLVADLSDTLLVGELSPEGIL